ncbi:MAG: 16S rRNA (adenine(1518)-N(6)/adenine(1519)-N(6))-dimethyltransferase RsmA [Proteobacteria bacterium]|nr:16S rRNA (adenine(1518)-N(6)/adenine(1519)-N(6))-dimethyltransferase RsmA [Pseudomonadota bacterium]
MPLLSTSEIIKKYGLNAKKSLGQNFILDKNFTDKIARAAGDLTNYEVLEVGSGPGSLTRSILDAGAKKLISIEMDERCIAALSELKEFYKERFEIIAGDALKIDEREIFSNKNKFKIIANLPYNIGTVLIFKWLKIAPQIASMHLMLQKEVVQRITAKTNDNHYGRLAVMVNFLCHTKMLFTVNKSVFTPPPKVTSAIVEIIPREKPLFDVEFEKLEKVVASAFNQRRKMLKSSLKNIFENPEEVLLSCKIRPDLRPENLKIEEFCKLAQQLK